MNSQVPHLRWSGQSDTGRFRSNNEDSFLGLQFNSHELIRLGRFGEGSLLDSDKVFAVSDGMGGAQAGEFASNIALEKITTLLPRAFQRTSCRLPVDFAEIFNDLFQQIHRALVHLGQCYEECRGMETTLSLCWFTPHLAYFAHIGDSRIYHWSAAKGKLQQMTEDDTHVGWLLRNQKITEWEARVHPGKNVLQKALGAGNLYVTPQVGTFALNPGDRILLCTDGLCEGLYDTALLEALLSPVGAGCGKQMVDASVAQSGRDNTTAMIIEVL